VAVPDVETRLERIETSIISLTGATGELVRENRALVQGLTSDRGLLRETLRDLGGFVATAGIALERLERQVARLAEVVDVGFARLQLAIEETSRETQRLIRETSAETQRLIVENNRLIVENNRLIAENNHLIAANNEVIRRLLDILSRGRENGEGPPASG
jgi:hypothetical protein